MNIILLPNAGQYTISRHLPKTGQEIQYAANDDGDLERGWWRGRTSSPFNLNKERFIIHTISGADVVIDRATGLMWPRDCTGTGGNGGAAIGTWAAAIAWAEALNFAGFTDWHLPNMFEMYNLVNFGANPGWYPEFQNVINNAYWTTTTPPTVVTSAMVVRFQYYGSGYYNKLAPGVSIYVLAVREAAI